MHGKAKHTVHSHKQYNESRWNIKLYCTVGPISQYYIFNKLPDHRHRVISVQCNEGKDEKIDLNFYHSFYMIDFCLKKWNDLQLGEEQLGWKNGRILSYSLLSMPVLSCSDLSSKITLAIQLS